MRPKAIKIWQASEVKLSYKTKIPLEKSPIIRCSKDAYELFLESWDEDTLDLIEEFKVVLMDRKCTAIATMLVGQGGFDTVMVDARLIFTAALKKRAHGMIVCHNHPSGVCQPSKSDIEMTKHLCQIGELLNIKIYDHVIISRKDHFSLADNGQITFKSHYLSC